jgi:hypothetical protein
MSLAKVRFAIILVLPVVLAGQGSLGQSTEQSGTSLPSDNVVLLFNGTTLDGLDTWLKDSEHDDPRDVFSVTDGMLHISGDGLGALITRDKFRNYHLVLEYKWGERTWHKRKNAARDSGLLIHSNGKLGGYDGIWMPAIEIQIIEGGVGDFLFVPGDDESGTPIALSLTSTIDQDRDGEAIWSERGERKRLSPNEVGRINWCGRDPDWTDTIGFRGPQDKDSKFGLWTRIDVISEEGHVQAYVNGVKVNEAFEVSPREGRIQLQSELAEIFVRKWELWPVGKGPAIAPAKH